MRRFPCLAAVILAGCSESLAGDYYHTSAPAYNVSHIVLYKTGEFKERVTFRDTAFGMLTQVAYGHWRPVGPSGVAVDRDSVRNYDILGKYVESHALKTDTIWPAEKYERAPNSADLEYIPTDTLRPVRYVKLNDDPGL